VKLATLLREGQVIVDLRADTPDEALRKILSALDPPLAPQALEGLIQMLLRTIEEDPAAIHEDVWIPHARHEALGDFVAFLATLKKPISLAGTEPASGGEREDIRLIIVLITSQTKNVMMLQALAAVAKLLMSKEIRQGILGARTPGRIIKIIEESGIDVKRTLCAEDIMDSEFETVTLDTPVVDALRAIASAKDDAVPVLNQKDEFAGEISSREIIKLGIPEYIDLLSDVSFLKSFEPFENYFRRERDLRVRDLYKQSVLSAESETPLVEVAHKMISGNKRRVYILKNRKLVGVIHRKNFITKVLQT
jgi:PTS system nitrogen regulatory IIA component